MDEVRQEECLVIPTGTPFVEVLHQPGITRQVLQPDPYLTERELRDSTLVQPPPVRVPDPVETS